MSQDSKEQDGQSTPTASGGAPLAKASPNRVGRPPTPAKKKVGRPKGNTAILAEYQERMLNSPKSRKVLDKLFDIALDDDHKHQAVCIKLVIDRIVPLSHLEKEKGGGLSGITIKMVAAGDVQISTATPVTPSDDIDAEYEEVE
jgi:hypothetical protein